MKKLVILVATLLAMGITNINAQEIKREGKVFSKEVTQKAKPIDTGYLWEDSKGNQYPIMINPNSGACYIIRISKKTGKEYKQYMDTEISQQIAKELGITYKSKSDK